MTSKVNIGRIFADHCGTLRNYRTRKLSWLDVGFFFGLPTALGMALWKIGWSPGEPFLQGGLAAMSIMTGLMFSILVLLYDFRRKGGASDEQELERNRLQELYYNVSYMILVGLLSAAVLALGLAFSYAWLSAMIGALLFHAFFTLLMLLKRIHVMLDPA